MTRREKVCAARGLKKMQSRQQALAAFKAKAGRGELRIQQEQQKAGKSNEEHATEAGRSD